jgi:dTDP-4-amino-4,6-dideoxygalactose transaminase
MGQGVVCVAKDSDLANWIHRYACVGRAIDTEVHYDSRKGLVPTEDVVTRRFRVSELESAVGLAQMERYKELVSIHLKKAHQTKEGYENFSFLRPQKIPQDRNHGYGKIAFVYEGEKMGVGLERFKEALKGEEISSVTFNPHSQPAYLEPALQEAHVYKHQCPIRCPLYEGKVSYERGICPVAEDIAPKLLFIKPFETKDKAEEEAAKLERIFKSLQK